MLLEINNIPIYFPYDNIYPEQLKYIKSLLKQIQDPGHILIEMPSGTGKTISILSCLISYQIYCKSKNKEFKIIYCTRTIAEIEKALEEMKKLIDFIKRYIEVDFLGLGLSRRGNMCVNDTALAGNVDSICRSLISKFTNLNCDFFDNTNFKLPKGVYTFEDIRKLGKEEGFCPYYMARKSLIDADCIIYPYNYMIDPSIFSIVTKKLSKEAIVVFDEAHNIDSHCIQALSIELNRKILVGAGNALKALEKEVKLKKEEVKKRNLSFYKNEESLKHNKLKSINEDTDAFPYYFTPDFYINEERDYEYTPGNLRQSNHFISVIKRLIEFFKAKIKSAHLTTESVDSFLSTIYELTFIEKDTLRFSSQRLAILIYNLQFEHPDLHNLKLVSRFATMVSIYNKGFEVIFEPYDSMVDALNPILRLYCMDSSICMKHIFQNFRNVLITSGTLSPMEMYSKILDTNLKSSIQIDATLERNTISPLIITKGDDQMLLNSDGKEKFMNDTDSSIMTTSFKYRVDGSVVRNYGSLLINLSKTVPDNIVVFFPSYLYMEEIVTLWSKSTIINDIVRNKLIFIETPNFEETAKALEGFKSCCDTGRGGMLFCVARGKLSEGVDLEDGYGRAAVILGIPFMFTESVRLKRRLKYLQEMYGIKEYDFLSFDAMRQTSQCLGRVLRKKNDYGLMILADQRFNMKNKIEKLPRWIKDRIEDGHVGLSIEMAMNIAKMYYKLMAQPLESYETTLIDQNKIQKLFLDDE